MTSFRSFLRSTIALPQLATWLTKAPADATEPTLRTKPPLLDRTDGLYRKFPARPQDSVRTTLQPQVDALLALQAPELRALGLELLVKYHLQAPAEKVAALVTDTKIPPMVRLEGLRLLAAQGPDSPELAKTLELWTSAASDSLPPALRSEARRILAKRDAVRGFEAARLFVSAGEVDEQQTAWKRLRHVAPTSRSEVCSSLEPADLEVGATLGREQLYAPHE